MNDSRFDVRVIARLHVNCWGLINSAQFSWIIRPLHSVLRPNVNGEELLRFQQAVKAELRTRGPFVT